MEDGGEDDAVDVRAQDADDALAHHVAQCLRDIPEARNLTATQVHAILRDALNHAHHERNAASAAWCGAKRAYQAYQACRWLALGYTVMQAPVIPAVTRVVWWATTLLREAARR